MALVFGAKQFEHLARQGFERRLVRLIRDGYPAESADVSPADMSRLIAEQMRRAELYGLGDEQSSATFVMTAWLLGIDFDLNIPSMAQVLNAPELSARSKAQALADFTTLVFAELEAAAA